MCSAPPIHSSQCPGGAVQELQLGHCPFGKVDGGGGQSKQGSAVQSVWGGYNIMIGKKIYVKARIKINK